MSPTLAGQPPWFSGLTSVVEERDAFTPLSGWRPLTRLDHWVGGGIPTQTSVTTV